MTCGRVDDEAPRVRKEVRGEGGMEDLGSEEWDGNFNQGLLIRRLFSTNRQTGSA